LATVGGASGAGGSGGGVAAVGAGETAAADAPTFARNPKTGRTPDAAGEAPLPDNTAGDAKGTATNRVGKPTGRSKVFALSATGFDSLALASGDGSLFTADFSATVSEKKMAG